MFKLVSRSIVYVGISNNIVINHNTLSDKIVRQNCRNFGLVSKVLSDERFCPSNILSNISIQKSGKNQTKLSKFRLGVKKFCPRNFVP